jgi:hypothetical protein
MKFDKWSGILFWFIFALLVLFPAFILWAIVHEHRRVPEVAKAFSVEVGDLRAFLKATDYGLHDFETSQGVRNVFQKWQKGDGIIGKKTESVYIPIVIPTR